MDFSDGESDGEIQTGTKNTGFSIREIHICKHICTCSVSPNMCMSAADMDFSDGETQVFDTSLDFSIGEIPTGAKRIDFSNGEICILGDCLDFSNGEIQTGAKNRNPYIYAHMHIFGLSKCVYVCKHNWISLM